MCLIQGVNADAGKRKGGFEREVWLEGFAEKKNRTAEPCLSKRAGLFISYLAKYHNIYTLSN